MIWSFVIFYGIISFGMLLLTKSSSISKRIFAQKVRKAPKRELLNFSIEQHQILSRYFYYYNNLNHEGKLKFLKRLNKFIKTKQFVGMEGMQVTKEMEVLISASAIQLTFGLEKYLLEYFSTIQIHPHYFYSKILDAELMGGASETGVLMLSWEDFLLGYKNAHSNYNLGLHEMAHVLKINLIRGDDFDDKFSFYLDEWEKIGNTEFNRLKAKKNSVLRAYGGTNKHEFFAVCVEHFFENPDIFKEELPDIYNHLCFLLNQDPRNVEENYHLSSDFKRQINKNSQRIPIPQRIAEHYKYHGWHWSYTIMLAGLFGGTISAFLIYSITLIPVMHVMLWGAIGVVLAFIFHYRFMVIKNRIFNPADFGLYAIFGVMPLVAGLFMLINFTVRVSYFEEEHKISSYEFQGGELRVYYEGNAYSKYSTFRTLPSKNLMFVDEGKSIKLRFAKGIFGYPFLIGKEIASVEK
jgi:MtfA peptidase